MTLSIGQILKGRAACYHVTKILKSPTVFQARIVPFGQLQTSQSAKLAMIKNYPLELPEFERLPYENEYHNYTFKSIAQSQHIRALIDLVEHDKDSPPEDEVQPQCMVFEWMDTDLWQLPSKPFRTGSPLPRLIARSILEALVVLDSENGVHGDVNPNNVFLSNVYNSSPVVKLGDLGNLLASGPMGAIRNQGETIRAPEVWAQREITGKADVFSLGVTLAHWLAGTTIFGPHDNILADSREPWCIAKLIRLLGPIGSPDPARTSVVDEFTIAKFLESSTFVHLDTGIEQKYVNIGSIREELEKIEGPIEPECIEFIQTLLHHDPFLRPDAKTALQHSWLKDLGRGDAVDMSVD